MELETDQKQPKQKVEHVEKLLLQLLPVKTHEGIIKMESQIDDNIQGPTVFVFPGIEGCLNVLKLITSQLKAHVYGLQ